MFVQSLVEEKKKTDTNGQDVVSRNTKGGEYVGNISKKTVDNAKELGYASQTGGNMNLTNTCKLVIVLALSWLVITAVTYSCDANADECYPSWHVLSDAPDDSHQELTAELEVENYVDGWFAQWYGPKSKLKRRAYIKRAIVPIIVDVSFKHNIDPMLTAVIMSHESGFDTNAVSSAGAIGLMQNKGTSLIGCDMTTIRGQVDCGVSWLKQEIEKCGSVLRGMNAYQVKMGKCGPVIDRAKYRYRVYRRAI